MIKRSGKLGTKDALHLITRASFSGSIDAVKEYAQLDVDAALDKLFEKQSHPEFRSDSYLGGHVKEYHAKMDFDGTPSWFGKASAFLMDMTACRIKGAHSNVMRNWFELLRWGVTQPYHRYIGKIIRNLNAGRRLDLFDNRKTSVEDKEGPNDNFSRELFELFTIGLGPQIGAGDYTYYTEHDIEMASLVLTGYAYTASFDKESNNDPELGWTVAIEARFKHDTSDKQFSAAFDNRLIKGSTIAEEREELVDMIFKNPRTSYYLASRLYRYYVSDIPNETVITELATLLRDNDFMLEPVLRVLFASEHFYSSDIVGSKVASPLELWFFSINFLGGVPELDRWLLPDVTRFHSMDQPFYDPEDIAGHKPCYQAPLFSRLWIAASSLQYRYKYFGDLVEGYAGTVLLPLAVSDEVDEVVENVCNHLIVGDVPKEKREIYILEMLDGGDNFHWKEAFDQNDTNMMTSMLDKLAVSLCRSAEYQII